MDQPKLPSQPPPGAPLVDHSEELYRNVRTQWYDGSHVSSLTFTPGPQDDGFLSVDRSSLTKAREAFERFLARPGAQAVGVVSVTVAECVQAEAPPLENPLNDNGAHSVVDFRAHNNSQRKKRAIKLRDAAVARPWAYFK